MNIDDIRAADRRLEGHVRRTPLLSSPFLDQLAGKRILVKAEGLQHGGSFKFRGATSAISKLDEDTKKRGIIAYSSGNHAQGIAIAAKRFGAPSMIVMPSDAPQIKIDNTRALGATVVLYDRDNEDRDEVSNALVQQHGFTLIKPFDNEDVIAGQATVGLEIAKQTKDMGITDARVLVPCGGGGLTAGVALALESEAPKFRVHPVEPEGFDDVARSLISGQREHNEKLSGSICDAILTAKPGEITFPVMQKLCAPGVTVSDDDCLRAIASAFLRLKIVIEPGGASALAYALYHSDKIQSETIIAIASGANIDASTFATALSYSNLSSSR